MYLHKHYFYLIYLYFKERLLILAGHASACLYSQYFGGGDRPISMGSRPSRATQCDTVSGLGRGRKDDTTLLTLWCFIWCFSSFYWQNLEIKTDTAKSLADSLDRADSPDFPYLNTLLRILATRCMMQAVYFCSGMDNDFHHYGLASPIYTHFTSPIRRYCFFHTKLKEGENGLTFFFFFFSFSRQGFTV